MSDELHLEPCPFCGGEAALACRPFGTIGVHCIDCGASAPSHPVESEAIAAWNTRKEPTL